MTRRSRWIRPAAALSGLIAAGVLIAVSELVAALLVSGSSPIVAVSAFVVDVVPRPLKEFAITAFGDQDKLVLLAGVTVAAAIAAAIAGLVQLARPPFGLALLAVGGVAALVATVTRADAGALSWLAPSVGTLVALTVLALLSARVRRWGDAGRDGEGGRARVNRRQFLVVASASAAGAVLVGIAGRVLTAVAESAADVRAELRLPEPRSTVTLPEGAELDVSGLSPIVTPNADFYRVDTALTVPDVDPDTWTLRIDGMVDEPFELTFAELLDLGLDEYAVTLTCVSNEVGGGLVGNAIWLGVPVRDLLRRAAPQSDADMVLSRSVDGYTASTPLSALVDDDLNAILAVGMNGEPLPLEHGFPVRMVVPGLYGYVSATKWLTQLTVTRFDQDEAYWTPRGYSAKAPIKLSSRVDTPKIGSPVEAGTIPVAGMAWAQPVGVAQVEVKIDDEPWQKARLSTPIGNDTWVQWVYEWKATAGQHYITVRATDNDGTVQTEESAPIAPNGSSGWQRTLVTVR